VQPQYTMIAQQWGQCAARLWLDAQPGEPALSCPVNESGKCLPVGGHRPPRHIAALEWCPAPQLNADYSAAGQLEPFDPPAGAGLDLAPGPALQEWRR
jgi:hypothetical protein